MSVPAATDGGRRRLPRRDFFLLPALSLATALVLLLGSEVTARLVWADQEQDACRIEDPQSGIPRFRPRCVSRVKVPEGPWVDNVYNDCGYRTRESCGPAPAGTTRIAVIGTSFSYGYMTPYESAYTTLAGEDLMRRCGRPFEFQNLGFPNYDLVEIYRRVDEALALRPALLMLAINPVDVRKVIDPQQMAGRNGPPPPPRATEPRRADWLKDYLVTPLRESRAMYVAQHYLYQDPETYLKLYLLYGDSAGYVRSPSSASWRQRYDNLELILTDIAEKARRADVPVVLFLGPQPSQVALVNSRAEHAGVDAFAFSHEVEAIGARHGVQVIDPLPAFQGRARPMSLFYVVDGHFADEGQRILAQALVDALALRGGPGLEGCAATSLPASAR